MPIHAVLENKRILIVDDESVNRKMLRMVLKNLGHIQTLEAEGGDQAVEMAQSEVPDLILMDIMMPDMDGLEASRKIKEEEATKNIPIIFLSALDDAQSKTQGFAAGGVDYVSKPFDAQELSSRVLAHLALKEQTDILQGRSSRLEAEVNKRTQELEKSKIELSRNYAYLQSINELLDLSLQELNMLEILDKTLDIVLNNSFLAVEKCGWIFLHIPETNSFQIASSRNPHHVPPPVCELLPENICACSLENTQDRIVIHPLEENAQYRCSQCPEGICCIPFSFEGQMLGLLVIRLRPDHTLDSGEHNFLNSISRTLAGIVIRKNTAQAMQKSENLYRTIFETTHNATCIIEEDGRVGLVNSAFSSLSRLSKGQIEGIKHWQDFVHPTDHNMLSTYREIRLKDPQKAPKSFEFRFVDKDSQEKQVLSSVDHIPGTRRIVVSLLDVTDQKNFQAELERRALYDTLTGLPNRSLFRTIVGRLVESSDSRKSNSFAMLFLDLDRFSLLNESLGHQAGDLLLQESAQRLRDALETKDTVCRFSSDEFVILLEQVHDYSEVVIQAERLRSTINKAFILGDQEVHTTCCIGITMPSSADRYHSADDIIRDAEMAMHRAKQEGLNSIKAFRPEMHEQTSKLLDIERDLHQALKRDEFEVFYQPIIDLGTLRLIGLEGLIRWHHPHLGLVSPGEFIPVAEETDLILPIGNRVLEMACEQFGAWLREFYHPNLFVSINLSAKQFKERELVRMVCDALDRASMPAGHLKLEITETVIMSDVQASSAILAHLKEMGIQLAMDDFGTGYSSLSYLQSLPINYIKIDSSFVWGMQKNRQNTELIKAIVAMGHSMDHLLIAEGIETLAHVQLLQSLGCDMGQGFYFAKPMPAHEAQAYMETDFIQASDQKARTKKK